MSGNLNSAALLAVAALMVCGPATAQTWPTKPVRIINPFPAGGGTDTFVRPYAVKMGQVFGQQFLVENQGGAGGTVGAANAARQPGDGYTLFAGAIHHTIAETLYTKLPYHLEKNFSPISVLALVPHVVVVHPKHNFKSLKELIEFGKANPGKLNYGSAGSGTAHHLAGELFFQSTGAKLTHVPFQGAGPMMLNLLSGVVDMAFDGMGTSANQVKGGKLRPLAVTGPQRSSIMPDVPTMTEAGVPGFELITWYAMWAVAGTPKPIIDRLHAEQVKFLQQPDIKELWASQSADAGGQPPEQFAQFIRSEIEKWGKVVKQSGLKIDN
jgi:tripartite-type tricarboxylate transporter receptor subunit TctC